MKRIFTLTFLLLTIVANTVVCYATDSNNKTKNPDNEDAIGIDSLLKIENTIVLPNETIDFLIDEKLDSMANSWFVNNIFDLGSASNNEENSDSYSTKDIPDSVFMGRLKDLNYFIDLSYNPTVRNTIAFYAERRREKIEIMLGLMDFYFPMFEEVLDKYNLPLELKYMAVIESALNPKAFSRAGASGLWQFILGTGKLYKLEVNTYVDERRDPLKSTEAAAKYLSDLYKIYGDWHLVIAAYNCGPGNVNKAIKRSDNKKDYWEIYYRLPRETRGYVPGFIAASYICNYYKLHGYNPRKPSFSISTDTIMVSNYLNFKQISEQLGIDIEMLRDINPMYKRDIIPASYSKKYPLVLPTEHISKFIETENEIFAHKRNHFFPDNQIKNPAELKSTTIQPSDIKGKDKIIYTVKSGDNIGYIANKYNVKINDVKEWNNLRSNLININQKLTLYVPSGKAEQYNNSEAISLNNKQDQTSPATATNASKTSTNNSDTNSAGANAPTEILSSSNSGQYHYYTVKSGDNLWEIAKKYPGTSAEEIRKLNGISNTRGLSIGQQIKIMKN